MKAKPFVEAHPDGFKATWPGFPRAFALFSVTGDRVVVTDIFRDPAQPRRSGGQMLAEAFTQAGVAHPRVVRMANILDTQPTTLQIQQGVPPADTVLGLTLTDLATALGGCAVAWNHGVTRGKLWIEATIQY